MSLTITINRIEGGLFRAAVAEDPRLVIEHGDLPGLVEELKQALDRIAVTPDGRLALLECQVRDDAEETAARARIERTALRNEELDELIDPYPGPARWGDEPGWSDVLRVLPDHPGAGALGRDEVAPPRSDAAPGSAPTEPWVSRPSRSTGSPVG